MCKFTSKDGVKCIKKIAGTYHHRLITCEEHRCVTKKDIVNGGNITEYKICINPKGKENTCQDGCSEESIINPINVLKTEYNEYFDITSS